VSQTDEPRDSDSCIS